MSLTPIPPERCSYVAPIVIERSEGGYRRVALDCGVVRGISAEARQALSDLGRREPARTHSWPPPFPSCSTAFSTSRSNPPACS
jgi:hypothetical protein